MTIQKSLCAQLLVSSMLLNKKMSGKIGNSAIATWLGFLHEVCVYSSCAYTLSVSSEVLVLLK